MQGCLAIGSLNKEFYKWNRVPDEKLYFSPFCVDNNFFALDVAEYKNKRNLIRSGLKIKESDFVVLVVSKFIPLKRISDVIESCGRLSAKYSRLHLILVGSGPLEDSLQNEASKHRFLKYNFFGFCNQSDLPSIYAAADVFVFSSENDSWGLALNEAMAAGLPSIVSDQVGASPDLVEGKGTGFVYTSGDIDQLSMYIEIMLNDTTLREAFSKKAREVIADWDVSVCAEQFISTCNTVLSHRSGY